MGFFDSFFTREKKEKLDRGMQRTQEGVFSKLRRVFTAKRTIDDDFLDELEEVFVTSDVGVDTAVKIINRIKERAARDRYVDMDELNEMLLEEISDMLADSNNATLPAGPFSLPDGKRPYVIMVVGVNGVLN